MTRVVHTFCAVGKNKGNFIQSFLSCIFCQKGLQGYYIRKIIPIGE